MREELSGFARSLNRHLPLNPFNQGDLGRAVQAKWEEGPPYPPIDIQPVSAGFVPAPYATIASRRKPESGYARHLPLPAVTVPAKDQVDGMMRLDRIEDVRSMCQQHCKSIVGARRDTSKIRAVKRWIIDTDDC